jgi:hypothetical protein
MKTIEKDIIQDKTETFETDISDAAQEQPEPLEGEVVEKAEWEKYFENDDELEAATDQSDEPVAFQPVQQDKIKSFWARGGAVLFCCVAACTVAGIAVSSFFGSKDPSQQIAAKPVRPVDPDKKLVGKLKAQNWFNRQGNEDDKFKNSGKKGDKAKGGKKTGSKKPLNSASTPASSYVPLNVSTAPERVASVRSLPIASSPQPIPSFTPRVSYQQATRQTEQVDPNQRWAQIQQASTVNIQGVEQSVQSQEVAQADPSQSQSAQNVADWQTIQGSQQQPSSSLGKTIAMKTEVRATLQTPISSSGTHQAVLALDEPLKSGNEVVLPSGTMLAASVQSDGAAINLAIQSAYLNGQDQPIMIQGDSIMVLASNKQFLIAQQFNKKGGFGNVFQNFALGAVSGAVEQVLSPSSSTIVSSGSTSTTINNVSRSLTNSALGGVRGGINSILSNIQAQNSSSESQASVSGLKAGTHVRLVFTAPMNI